MTEYTMVTEYTMEIRTRRSLPTMQVLADAVAEELERRGYSEFDYEVIVHGPPELRIGVVR